MTDKNFVTQNPTTTKILEQMMQEINETPQENLPSLLQIIRLFRESVTLKSAEESFRQGWQEAIIGDTIPVLTPIV